MIVIGGTFKNTGYNSPIVMGEAAGVNALLNLDSDASGNVGKAVSSYLTATESNTSAFVNFNGGELRQHDFARLYARARHRLGGNAPGTSSPPSPPVTGALTIRTADTTASTTVLGPGGGYYWKMNLDTAGVAKASTPATFGTPVTATGAGTDVSGTNWDAVLMDTVAVTSFAGSPFTITASGFHGGGTTGVAIGPANTQAYPMFGVPAGRIGVSESVSRISRRFPPKRSDTIHRNQWRFITIDC